MADALLILGTAISVAGLMGASGLFVLRLVISQDVRPVGDAMIRLQGAMDTLASTLADSRETSQRNEREVRDVLRHLETIVSDIEGRVRVLESATPRRVRG